MVKQQLGLTVILKHEKSQLKKQESEYADQVTRSSEEMETMIEDGRAYKAHENDEMNSVRSEMKIESAVFLGQQVGVCRKGLERLHKEYIQLSQFFCAFLETFE